MVDHQAPSLNINTTTPRWFDPKSHPLHILGLKPFSSLRALPLKLSSPSKPPWQELFKLITSNHAPQSKPSQNQITKKTQKPTNQITKSRTTSTKITNHKTTKSQIKESQNHNKDPNHIHRNQSTKPTKQPKSQNQNDPPSMKSDEQTSINPAKPSHTQSISCPAWH